MPNESWADCGHARLVAALTLLASALWTAARHPFRKPFDNVLVTVVQLLQAGGTFAMGAHYYSFIELAEGRYCGGGCRSVSEALLKVGVAMMTVRAAFQAFGTAGLLISGRRTHLQLLEWDEDGARRRPKKAVKENKCMKVENQSLQPAQADSFLGGYTPNLRSPLLQSSDANSVALGSTSGRSKRPNFRAGRLLPMLDSTVLSGQPLSPLTPTNTNRVATNPSVTVATRRSLLMLESTALSGSDQPRALGTSTRAAPGVAGSSTGMNVDALGVVRYML
eukprot:Hpha_TRINITY_DN720_c0_g2::TRINITY_DN720_c0_g2_i1::g.28926::m.28926